MYGYTQLQVFCHHVKGDNIRDFLLFALKKRSFFYQNKGSSESSRVKGWLADLAILCSIPAWGGNLCHRKRGFVAHSLTTPTLHRPDMTEICEKVHKTASNQSILPMRQCLFYRLAVLENSVLSMGWDNLHETLKVTSVVYEFFFLRAVTKHGGGRLEMTVIPRHCKCSF